LAESPICSRGSPPLTCPYKASSLPERLHRSQTRRTNLLQSYHVHKPHGRLPAGDDYALPPERDGSSREGCRGKGSRTLGSLSLIVDSVPRSAELAEFLCHLHRHRAPSPILPWPSAAGKHLESAFRTTITRGELLPASWTLNHYMTPPVGLHSGLLKQFPTETLLARTMNPRPPFIFG
jgi:hypothetical protein